MNCFGPFLNFIAIFLVFNLFKTYKISDTQGSYGQLMRQTGVDNQGKPILTPTSVSRNDMIQRIEGIEKG